MQKGFLLKTKEKKCQLKTLSLTQKEIKTDP